MFESISQIIYGIIGFYKNFSIVSNKT